MVDHLIIKKVVMFQYVEKCGILETFSTERESVLLISAVKDYCPVYM